MHYLTAVVFMMTSTGMINAEPYQNEGHNRQMSGEIDHYDTGNRQNESPIDAKTLQPSYPVVGSYEMKNPVIDIRDGGVMPITLRFNSRLSPLNIVQNHIKGSTEKVHKSSVVEDPSLLYMTVEKPIIQTVNEIISPRREVIRHITATREVVKTVVAKHNDGAGNSGGGIDNYNDNDSYKSGGDSGRNGNMQPYRKDDHLSSDSAADSPAQ